MPLSFLVATDQEMLIVDAETTPQIPVSADSPEADARLQRVRVPAKYGPARTSRHRGYGLARHVRDRHTREGAGDRPAGADYCSRAAWGYSRSGGRQFLTDYSAFGARTPGAEGGALWAGAGAAGEDCGAGGAAVWWTGSRASPGSDACGAGVVRPLPKDGKDRAPSRYIARAPAPLTPSSAHAEGTPPPSNR